MPQVCTGPQGVITVTDGNGVMHLIGRARNIAVNSDFQRDFAFGIGSVLPKEAPVIRWQGTVSVEQYNVISTDAILHAFDMTVQDNEKFFNYLFFESGLDLLITSKRKIQGEIVEIPVISVSKMFITGEGWTMAENAIWGHNGNFAILQPPRLLSSAVPKSENETEIISA